MLIIFLKFVLWVCAGKAEGIIFWGSSGEWCINSGGGASYGACPYNGYYSCVWIALSQNVNGPSCLHNSMVISKHASKLRGGFWVNVMLFFPLNSMVMT